ncbi:oxidoreductase family protein [Seiridium cupressi]
MAPIRTAVIGLSSNAVTNWANRAHLPYLLSPKGRSKFEIIALCNSSVDAAKKAVRAFDLAPETRAYGSPEDLAADPDVQLVVVSTRVDKHYETALPSLKTGKNVYVEWPLAENLARAEELAQLAKEKGVKTVVGLQGRFTPPLIKLRELIASGRIGKVLSSKVSAFGGAMHRENLTNGLRYFTDRKVGGNFLTIGFGHISDNIQYVLGDIQNIQSKLQIQRPDAKLIDRASGEVTEVVKSDVPDLVFINGTLPESDITVEGASISIDARRGQPFKGEPAFIWTINGGKGEILLTSYNGPSIGVNSADVVIKIHDHETDEVQKVDWEASPSELLPPAGRSIAALYEAYAAGDASKYADFEHALKRHKQLDSILASFDAAK